VSKLDKLKRLLSEYGEEVHASKQSIPIKNKSCIDKYVPSSPGVYWIETNMPSEEMTTAIFEVTGKRKRVRQNPPNGTRLIEPNGVDTYVVYSGTEEDINKRLKQHLFNRGHDDTVKLGCIITKEPFSNYTWKIGFKQIDSYELRYAVEAWWRLNKGWPKFCLR